MRQIKKIIIHAADTPADMDIGAAEIDQWHKARGWNGIGYHYVIRRDGTVGWVCVKSGSPGTWKAFGTIAA